jgi:cytochrome c biogenesis protein CcdA
LGLTLSFAVAGLFIATVGVSIGLDAAVLRQAAAFLMVAIGSVLLSQRLQQRFALATARLGSSGEGLLSRLSGSGWAGQFSVGLVLGLVWSPCVGPTLGAASTLAAQGNHIGQIAMLMLVFGLGAGTPLLVIGSLSREAMARSRGSLLSLAQRGKWWLGLVLVVMGVLILGGWDKRFEAWAVENSPAWLTELTTRY